VETPEQLIALMGWDTEADASKTKRLAQQLPLFGELSEEERAVVDLLRVAAEDLDALAFRLRMPVNRLSVLLLQMEFRGLVRLRPGNRVELRG
jgi:DNA processing protein